MVVSNLLMHALQQQIVGQEYAITTLTRTVTLALAGMSGDARPLAVLLFAGPTGAGKTHTARALARVLAGNERNVIYIDCERLERTGDWMPGFERQLLAAYRRSQTFPPAFPSAFSILIVEEIDKAPPAFRDYIATAVDRGELFMPGHLFWLRNCFIVLTSTLSKKQTDQLVGRTIGFFRDGETDTEMPRQHLMAIEEIDNLLGAHLVSRIDEIVIFERLSEQNILTLFERELARIESFLAGFNIGFIIDQDARTFLLKQGLEDLAHGTRQIRRVVRNTLEFPLADLMISGRLTAGTTVQVKHESPRRFLNFQILIPRLAPAPWPLPNPLALKAGALR